ncbi:hypothetical protein [Dysosmobacter sp.]|uniref:hypothetical protein n=1 Tax=Dysosmobacter sp. TaxID=2591382 RepID=UPI002A8B7DE6|nr:hypothetical protein [Dysosmobacter sp.]MDY3281991.1 hypothetical protein [Dysosmobacter sp.]
MKRLTAALLASALVLGCAACAAPQSPPPAEPREEEPTAAEIARQAYDCIESAETLCKSGMIIIDAAWHFGIWDAPECGADAVMEQLSRQTGFDVSFLEQNGGCTADELANGDETFDGWEYCVTAAENCLAAYGTYDALDQAMNTAQELIRELPADDLNSRSLKDYYTEVAAYAAYFEDVTGSYNDLTAAITRYESDIQAVKKPLLFDFG